MRGTAMSCCRRRRRRGLLFQWFPLSPLPPLPSPFRTGRSGPAGFARRWRPSRMLSTKWTSQTAVSVVVTSLMSTTTAITNTNQFFFFFVFFSQSFVQLQRSIHHWKWNTLARLWNSSKQPNQHGLCRSLFFLSLSLMLLSDLELALVIFHGMGMISQFDFPHKEISFGWLIF